MLSTQDKALLQQVQNDFPVCERPFAEIARRLDMSEREVIRRLKAFQKNKVLRYIGAVFETKKLGIVSSLIAMRVPRERLVRTVAIINRYPQVSHNYLRRGPLNVWFTLSAASAARLERLFREIKRRTGIREAFSLATRTVFKIDARFSVPS